jgi:hypothetical protein
MQSVYTRFVELNKALEMEIKKAGKEFMHSDSLGFIVTCPSNIGTGLRVGCHIKRRPHPDDSIRVESGSWNRFPHDRNSNSFSMVIPPGLLS